MSRVNGARKLDNDQFKRVFLYAGILAWNKLPADVIGTIDQVHISHINDSNAVKAFKNRLLKHLPPENWNRESQTADPAVE